MPYTFGDLIDATNTAKPDTPLVVVDTDGTRHTVEDVRVEVDDNGAVTEVKLTTAPA